MRRRALVALALAAPVATAACGGHTPVAAPRPPAVVRSPAATPLTAVVAPAGGLFGRGSVFAQEVGSAPVAADSAAIVRHLVGTITDRYGGLAAFNAHQYDPTLTVVGPDAPTQDVGWDDCQHQGREATGLAGQLAAVPITAGTRVSSGTDAEASIWQPSSGRLWELWEAHRAGAGWTACFGGRIDDVATSPGFFPGGFGAAASGLSTVGGMVGIADVMSGSIDHAVSLEVVDARAGRWSYPAQRTDGGSDDPTAVLEGQRLRLDPTLDVDALHLGPIATMVAKAAQTYGFLVTDRSGAVSVEAEDPRAAVAATGTDPWTALEQGSADYEVLRGFPWDRLQALPPDWGR